MTLAMTHWPWLVDWCPSILCNVFRERDIVRREDSQEGPFSSLQEFREFKDNQRQAKQQQQQQQSQPAQSSSDTQRRASSLQASSSNSSNGSSPSRGSYTISRSRSGRKEYDSL